MDSWIGFKIMEQGWRDWEKLEKNSKGFWK